MMKARLAMTLVLAACSSQPALVPQPGVSRSVVGRTAEASATPTPSASPTPPVRPEVISLTPEEPVRPPRQILIEAKGDVDGSPGDEVITLYKDGLLAAGAAHGDAEVLAFDAESVSQSSLRAVLIDKAAGLRGVLVTQPSATDLPFHHQLFIVSGEMLERVLDTLHGVRELRFPGDGTLRYIESGWEACLRAGRGQVHAEYPAVAVRDEVSRRLEGSEMGEFKRSPTKLIQRCNQISP